MIIAFAYKLDTFTQLFIPLAPLDISIVLIDIGKGIKYFFVEWIIKL